MILFCVSFRSASFGSLTAADHHAHQGNGDDLRLPTRFDISTRRRAALDFRYPIQYEMRTLTTARVADAKKSGSTPKLPAWECP